MTSNWPNLRHLASAIGDLQSATATLDGFSASLHAREATARSCLSIRDGRSNEGIAMLKILLPRSHLIASSVST